jgi:hypothetical protein
VGSDLAQLCERANIKNPTDPKSIDIQEDPLHAGAYIITLSLDSEPSYVWLTLFEQELWGSLDFWDRKVLVVGKALKLATTPDRVEEKLHWLEGLVAGTNRRVDDYNRKAKAEQEASDDKVIEEDVIRREVSTWALNRVRV